MAMSQLTGEFPHSMDAKGRVKMPAAWNEDLGKKFMVTRGTGNMLFIFSMPQWEVFSEKLMALPLMDPKAQALRRIFAAGANWTRKAVLLSQNSCVPMPSSKKTLSLPAHSPGAKFGMQKRGTNMNSSLQTAPATALWS